MTLNFWYFLNTIKHNDTKLIILIFVLYQNASTSQILEPSPQGLISSAGGPQIVQILGHQGMVLLQKSY